LITHVVFDFDGTLVDSREAAIRLYNEIAARHGYGQLTAHNLEEVRALGVLERCRYLKVPPSRLPALVVEVGREYRRAAASLRFVEGVRELLVELRRRDLRLAIASTNDEDNVRRYVAGWPDSRPPRR
jgi:phosphoglycolate phosphatase